MSSIGVAVEIFDDFDFDSNIIDTTEYKNLRQRLHRKARYKKVFRITSYATVVMSSLMLIGLFCITGSEFKALESDINNMNTVIASQHRIKNPENMPKTNKQVTLEQYLTEEERNALAKGLAESSDGVCDSCNVAVTGNTLTITFVMDSYVVGQGVTAETFADHLEEIKAPIQANMFDTIDSMSEGLENMSRALNSSVELVLEFKAFDQEILTTATKVQ